MFQTPDEVKQPYTAAQASVQPGYGAPAYPVEGGFPVPQQGAYPAQQGYPTMQQGGAAHQQGYPAQAYPAQAYPAQQQGYPTQQQGQPAQAYPAQQQSYPAQQQGYPAQQQGYAPASQQGSQAQQMQVTVPQGAMGGMPMQVHTPAGIMQVTVPPGLQPGANFIIMVGAAAPQQAAAPMAMAMSPVMAAGASPMYVQQVQQVQQLAHGGVLMQGHLMKEGTGILSPVR